MSRFLVNLALRGAGLPTATAIQVPPPSPFEPQLRKGSADSPEVYSETSPGPDTPVVPESASRKPEPAFSLESPAPIMPLFAMSVAELPSIQRLSETRPGTPPVGSVTEAASAAPRTPLADPAPASQELSVLEAAPPEPSTYPLPKATPPIAERETANPPAIGFTADPKPSFTPTAKRVEFQATEIASTLNTEPGNDTLSVPAIERLRGIRPQEPELPIATIRPAPVESPAFLQFPKVTVAATPSASSELPIEVRIGRVEVRAAPPSPSVPAKPNPPAPAGFDSYYRIRTYRG